MLQWSPLSARRCRSGRRGLPIIVVVLAVMLTPMAGGALADEPVFARAEWTGMPAERGAPSTNFAVQATDPLGLVVGVNVTRAYTLDDDVIDLWTCGISESASEVKTILDAEVGDYFDYHSGGTYRPVFTARGSAGSDVPSCEATAFEEASVSAEAAVIIASFPGGYARNRTCGLDPCGGYESFPDNNRIAVVGRSYMSVTAAHEIGHLIQWPHSYTGNGPDEYDNAMDLMSGNFGRSGNQYGTFEQPYETAAINKYAAGWIDPGDVVVVDPAGGAATLSATNDGNQMAVIWDGSSYYTLAARAPTTWDPIASAWAGVEVYRVDPCTDFDCTPGFRRTIPEPATPFNWSDVSAYDRAQAHVIQSGQTSTVGGVEVTVSGSGTSFTVEFGAGADPGEGDGGGGGGGDGGGDGGVGNTNDGSFTDDNNSVFEEDIEWLAATGITRGCNPPSNSRFCPDDSVTRGQMAAFLRRALPDLDDTGTVPDFGDTAASTFEGDIDWLAATGVTRGCNPPSNDRFCPDSSVTRGQMAAFLRRALPDLPATGAAGSFGDVSGSVFVDDIAWLAATGVTRGCNPPANTAFCPDDVVTRGQMAAFLRRALDG